MTDKMRKFTVCDEKDRIIAMIQNGKVVFSRYDDMTSDEIEYIINLFKDQIDNIEDVRDFLNFKSEENMFCS